jgi:hypothetical protein
MMPLDDTARTEVAQVHHQNRLSRAAIEADPDLNEQARADRIKASEDAHQQALDQIHAAADARARSEGEKAWKTAFGLPASAGSELTLAMRDAIDRVNEAGPQEVSRLLSQAQATGDRSLAAACGARAFSAAASDPLQSSAWGDIVTAYAAGNPARQQAISVLAGQAADARSTQAINDRFLRQIRRTRR